MRPGGIANARMYAATPAAARAWKTLFAWLADSSGIALEPIEHAYPAPLPGLWARRDLACAFMCGWPFAAERQRRPIIAAPVTREEGAPLYRTRFVVRADSRFATLEETFGQRLAWTVEDSHSGFNAPRHHLLRFRSAGRPRLYRSTVGPLVTPRRVIEAVLGGEAEVGPVDSYVLALLQRHEPELMRNLRVVASTAPTPIPPLVASRDFPIRDAERLGGLLCDAASQPELAPVLDALCLAGFATPDASDYDLTLAWAHEAEVAGYAAPG
jgi:ABC-type phosphate/phosphonate transport system substrate-binding protein